MAATWLNSLPLTADAVEAAVQHELLVRLLTARDARVLGPVSQGTDTKQPLVVSWGLKRQLLWLIRRQHTYH